MRFSIANILLSTTICAFALGAVQLLGYPVAFNMLIAAIIFAPFLIFLALCLVPIHSRRLRWQAGVGVSVVILIGMLATGLALQQSARNILAIVLVATCIWIPQWLFIAIIFFAWKAGLRSAEPKNRGLRVVRKPDD